MAHRRRSALECSLQLSSGKRTLLRRLGIDAIDPEQTFQAPAGDQRTDLRIRWDLLENGLS
jgi:hypothetical protein